VKGMQHHLRAAHGYIELGMFVEAADELECIAPEDRGHPAVLAYRYDIYSELEKWTHAEVARHLVKISPQNPGWWLNIRVQKHGSASQTPDRISASSLIPPLA